MMLTYEWQLVCYLVYIFHLRKKIKLENLHNFFKYQYIKYIAVP